MVARAAPRFDQGEADARGRRLGLSEGVAFYDALETNHSAVKVLGDETLRTIAREVVRTVLEQAELLSAEWAGA